MTQIHHGGQLPPQPTRPFECLRHHVWMAACDDCRKEHTPRIRRQKHTTSQR